ncbi:dynein intermediate chain, putative [Plasmodium sp. gorilla clade G1]|nr:dynein intermediate chain, putative [Plasmodium sp. gorilla clade G1]
MKNKNILHTDKKDKYIEPKENIKKKKEEIKKNEITKKHEINKKKLDIDTKNKTDSDYKNKREKEGVENKYVSNEIKYKTTDTDKKNNQLKNSILFDVHITNKDVETKGDTKISQTDVNSFIRTFFQTFLFSAVNLKIDKDVKHMLEINLSKELSDIIFNKSSSVLINKNYFFTLVQKFFKSDEYLSIKKSLTDYTFDDILMLQNVDTNKHSIVFDTNTYSYILEKYQNTTETFDLNKETDNNQNNCFDDTEKLNCIFIRPKKYISSNEEEIRKEINNTHTIQNRKKFKKIIYIKRDKIKNNKHEFVECDKYTSIKNDITIRNAVQEKTLDFYSTNSIVLHDKNSQTYKAVFKNLGIQYNIEFLNKRKEDILKSINLEKFLHKVFPMIEKSIIENIIILQKEQEQNLQSSDILSFKNIKYLNKIFIYTDVKYTTDKVVLFTLYLSLINYLIFIIYINNYKNDNFIEGVNTDSYILIWSYNNYINPLYALISPYQISSAIVNENDYNLVIAGCSNGLLVIWKLPPNFNGISVLNSKINEKTVNIEPYLFSSIEHSHKREVTSLIFLNDKNLILNEKKISISNQKNCHLLVSISVDGSILIWDATNIEIAETKINMKKKDKELADELYGYKPIFKINSTRPNTEYSLGYTYFHFMELNANVSSFFAFSEEGEYIVGNLYGCMQKDKNYSIINKINDDYKSFKTLVCVKRNTLIKYLIITLTDTNFYLWKENEEHPIFISPKSNEIYSCCEFSQTKISVIFIGKINGHIEIWNLSEQKNHCIYSLTISSYSLTCVSIFQNIDSNIFNSYVHKTKEEKKNKDDNDDINYDDYDDIIDTNEYLMNMYKYSYNKIIIGDSSGCVFVYEIEDNLLNSSKEEMDEFLLWIENRIYLNKQKLKRQIELCKEKENMMNKEEKNTNERKEQLKNKLDEEYKNSYEKYKSYLLGNKI